MKPRQKAHAWKIPAQDIFISLSLITSERVLNMGKCGYRERFIVFRIFTYLKYTRQCTYAHRPHTHYLTVYECPYFCFFDLLIMIKLLRASWLEMAQRVESWLFRFTASHSGAEKKTTKWRVEEDRTRLKTSTSNRRKKKKCLKTAINLSFDHPNRYQMGFLPRWLEFPTWTKKEWNENRW